MNKHLSNAPGMDEQYQRGMKLLRDNMYLLDELAKMLLEQEKVSGRVHMST